LEERLVSTTEVMVERSQSFLFPCWTQPRVRSHRRCKL